MTADLLAQAQAGDGEAFGQLVGPYRRELQVYCYRFLGSFADAEDVLQETMLSAWQGLTGFGARASIRTWLYKVATNRCLDALRSARRRPPASTPAPAEPFAVPEPTRLGEVLWLEPCPDDLLGGIPDATPGPEARYELAESVSLAFIKALQLLAPRQRAALILRDVLGYHASEAAQILGVSEESVTSALKRARATLERQQQAETEPAPPAGSAAEHNLVRRLTSAFERADVDAIVALLTSDAWFTMPPLPLEYQGRELAAGFLRATAFRPGWTARLIPARANGQPAFGFYARDPQSLAWHTVGLLVLTLSGTQIAAMTRFDPGVLPRFGLPARLSTGS